MYWIFSTIIFLFRILTGLIYWTSLTKKSLRVEVSRKKEWRGKILAFNDVYIMTYLLKLFSLWWKDLQFQDLLNSYLNINTWIHSKAKHKLFLIYPWQLPPLISLQFPRHKRKSQDDLQWRSLSTGLYN